jgi:hypothetical protein
MGSSPFSPYCLVVINGRNKKTELPIQATRLSITSLRPVAFRPRLATGLAFSSPITFCKNYAIGLKKISWMNLFNN